MKRLSVEQIEAAIKRDTSRMTRIANRLAKWNRMLKRARTAQAKPERRLADEVIKDVAAQVKPLQQAMAAAGITVKPVNRTAEAMRDAPPPPWPVEPADDPLDVRNQPWARQVNTADEAAKAEILAAQTAKKKVKAKASSEKSKAKRRGELRKMPLTGKAAIDFLRKE